MCLGGFADVLAFPQYVPGMTYVTADLTGEGVGQLPSSFGNYELMVCVREELSRAADLISRLARYTCEAELEAGETMDLPDFFPGSVIKALLFAHPSDAPVQFEFLGAAVWVVAVPWHHRRRTCVQAREWFRRFVGIVERAWRFSVHHPTSRICDIITVSFTHAVQRTVAPVRAPPGYTSFSWPRTTG